MYFVQHTDFTQNAIPIRFVFPLEISTETPWPISVYSLTSLSITNATSGGYISLISSARVFLFSTFNETTPKTVYRAFGGMAKSGLRAKQTIYTRYALYIVEHFFWILRIGGSRA